jgi:WD40 repeat protein
VLSASNTVPFVHPPQSEVRLVERATGRCVRLIADNYTSAYSIALAPDGRRAFAAGNCLRTWALPQEAVCTPQLSRLWSHSQLSDTDRYVQQLLREAEEARQQGRTDEAITAVRKARQQPGWGRAPQTTDAWARLGLSCRRAGLADAWPVAALKGHVKPVHAVCLSQDGTLAATGSWDKTVRLWDVRSGRCQHVLEAPDEVRSVALTPDAQHVIGGTRGAVRVWQTHSGSQVCEIAEGAAAFAVSPDGQWLISGAGEVWHLATGRRLRGTTGYGRPLTDRLVGPSCSLALSADGRLAATGVGKCDPAPSEHSFQVSTWDVATGRVLRRLQGHTSSVNGVSFSVNGKLLSGSIDVSLRLWDVRTGECLRTMLNNPEAATSQHPSWEAPFMVTSVCLSPDGRFGLSGSWDRSVRLWDVESGECLHVFHDHVRTVHSVSASADWRFVAAAAGNYLAEDSDDLVGNTVYVWELDWNLEPVEPAAWDEGARPVLEAFLTLQTPYATEAPLYHLAGEEEVALALSRRGRAVWGEPDFQRLLYVLGCAGYGWLRPDGVRKELEQMAASWDGPPPLL